MDKQKVVIYGGGGFAREVAWLVECCDAGKGAYEVACFVDDDEAAHGKLLNGIPVMSLQVAREQFPTARMVGGVGVPKTRQSVIGKAARAGFSFCTLVHPNVERSRWVEIGEGTIVCAGSLLTTNIIIGRHVQLNLDCTVGHDVRIGDFATLAPGVHLSGWVHIGERVYIGTGAVIINGTKDTPMQIGDDAVIGAGACVIKPVPPGTTVVGVPARPTT